MNSRRVPAALWLYPLLVLIAAIAVEIFDLGGFAGAMHAWGAILFYNFAPLVVGRELQRPSFATTDEIIFLVLAGIAVLAALARARIAIAAFVTAVTMALAVGIAWLAARQSDLALDYLYVSLALGLTFATGVLVRLALGDSEGTRLEEALGHRLPAAAMREISRRPELLKRSGETRNLTTLVCAIRDFAELADGFAGDPEGFAVLLRRVMCVLSEAVLSNGGTVDRVAPGRLTAFFNAPLNDLDHAVHACSAALGMMDGMEALNRTLASEGGSGRIDIGVGVNTGPGIVADFGSATCLDYSAAGGAAMRAEELKDFSAVYGFAVIAGEATRAAAETRLAFLQIDLSSGRSGQAAPLFAVIGNHQMRSSPKFRALQTFHRNIFEAYGEQDWRRARELIGQCRALSGASQRLYEFYLERIAQLEADPPDEDWNPAIRIAT